MPWRFVGPPAIALAAQSQPAGARVESAQALRALLEQHVELLSEGATFVVGLDGVLRLAPRRSEHIACAGGEAVLAAGELHLECSGATLAVAAVSNQSTGYCPDVSCWSAVAEALGRAGLTPPAGFTHPCVFRRCEVCHEINLVKDAWFFCTFCDAPLPRIWNVVP